MLRGNVGGEEDWVEVSLSVHEDHQPACLPLQTGFETRRTIDAFKDGLGNDKALSLRIATGMLADILNQLAGTLEPAVGPQIAVEVVNGMSGTAPMTARAMAEVAETS